MPVSTAQLNGGHKVARDGSVGVGEEGADLRTFYEIWQDETDGGTFQDFLAAIREPQKPVQSQILNPATGQPYDLLPAQVTDEQGKVPVRSALDSLSSGLSDLDGRSLYAQAQAAGYAGTEAEFYAALVAQPSGDGGPGGSSGGGASGWQHGETITDTATLPADGSEERVFLRTGRWPAGAWRGLVEIKFGNDAKPEGEYGGVRFFAKPKLATRGVGDFDDVHFHGSRRIALVYDSILPYISTDGDGYVYQIDAFSKSGQAFDLTVRHRISWRPLPEAL